MNIHISTQSFFFNGRCTSTITWTNYDVIVFVENRHIRKNCGDITHSMSYGLILNGVQSLIIDSELVRRSYFN